MTRFNATQQLRHEQDQLPPLYPAQQIHSAQEALNLARDLAQLARSGAAQRDREQQLPWAELEQFTRTGLGAISIPKAYGGPELAFTTIAEIFRTLSQADPSLGQIPHHQFGIVQRVLAAGTERQKHRLLGSVVQGYRIAHAGADPSSNLSSTNLQLGLDRNGQHYRLSGEAFYATGAVFAHWITTQAVDDEGRLVLAFIPRGTQGLHITEDWTGFGQRTTARSTVVLDQVLVAAENLIPIWKYTEQPNIQEASSQLIQAAIDAGIARAALEDATLFVRQYSRPWIDAQTDTASEDLYTLHEFGRLYLELDAAETLLERAAQILDQTQAAPITPASAARATLSTAKAQAISAETALLASEKLFELAGSRATLGEYNLDRHWRNARTHSLHDPLRWKYHAIGDYHLNAAHSAHQS